MAENIPVLKESWLDCSSDLCDDTNHVAQLAQHGAWFVRTRWKAAVICLLGAWWFYRSSSHPTIGFYVDFRTPMAVALSLLGTNTLYAFLLSRWKARQHLSSRTLCRFLALQVLTDYMNLSFLGYGLGGVETPTMVLFLPHIILTTLFFSRRRSFIMTVVGVFFATLPTFLEYQGALPTVSIFDSAHKILVISSNPTITAGYIVGITAGMIFCWYLVSDIAAVLWLRERQLHEAVEQLKLLDREKTQVTLRATHELKAPFAAIKSHVYTLRDGYCGPLPEKAQQVVERIGDRCDLLMAKITDIIHLGNLRSLIPSHCQRCPTDFNEILQSEVEEARLIAKPRSIDIRLQGQPFPCLVIASREHLATMIANLLQNAVNYSHEGGIVDVALMRSEEHITLRIEDRGIGIPAEHLDRIFEEHFRCNNAVRFNPNSSGMGLSLVREIVRLHDGTISVLSEPGRGSIFTVTFAPSTRASA
ncbi:MAG: HAMP domain-containing histidine kinase [Magnetococcus sp. THC-1_WYH]